MKPKKIEGKARRKVNSTNSTAGGVELSQSGYRRTPFYRSPPSEPSKPVKPAQQLVSKTEREEIVDRIKEDVEAGLNHVDGLYSSSFQPTAGQF